LAAQLSINAWIDNHAVYDAFLTPLEDGYYIRSGNKFYIKPCIWLFVGTKTIEELKDGDSKGSDFVSRLSLDTLVLSTVPADEAPFLHIENVHLGASIARARYPGLQKIHAHVVCFLGSLKTELSNSGISTKVSARDIRRVMDKELLIDNHGGGMWRNEENIWKNYTNLIDQNLYKTNALLISQMKIPQWIKILYDSPLRDPGAEAN
jgi:hypothetical protein